ncbi:MAG: HD domain-containing protein [Epulopiscium sp.]|nr:HD domain-containing protein [Candidatus Epulonipiscium sp.]
MPRREMDCLLEEVLAINKYLEEEIKEKGILIEGHYTGEMDVLKSEFNRVLSMLYEREVQLEEDEIEIDKYSRQLKSKNSELINRQSELEAAHSQLKAYTEEMERMNIELNRRVEELKNLFHFSQEVTSNFDKYELLRIALKDIVPFINSSFGAVFVSKEKGLRLVDTYYRDSATFSIIEPLAKRIISRGYLNYDISLEDVQIHTDIEKTPKFYKILKDKLIEKFKSMALVPVLDKNKHIVAFIVLLGEYIDENEKYLLSCYSNVLSIALENAKLYDDINKMFFDTVKVLANAIEVKDMYTKGHIDRVTDYSVAIAKKMNFEKKQLEKIKIAAALHDIGKIGVPDEILNKPAKLSEDEFNVIKLHPLKGYEIIKDIPALKDISVHVKQHHERIDGKGYPEGLKKEEISLEAKIISVADAFDAMTSDRPYRKGMNFKKAADILSNNKGSQFDEYVVNVFLNYLEENDNII